MATTDQEYAQIVDLRTMAYSRAGKIAIGSSAMADTYDQNANILAAWHCGTPVASLRIMTHPPDALWEHEQYVSLDHPDLPPRHETVEITRVCTHPDWRHSDLALLLFQRTVVFMLQLRRRYLLGSATANLLPLYTRIGCVPTTVQAVIPSLSADPHILFTGDVPTVLRGGHPSWASWSVAWSAVYAEVVRQGLLKPGPPHMRLQARLWRSARPAVLRLQSTTRGSGTA